MFIEVRLYICMNRKIIYSFQKINTAIFHGKSNRKSAELALPCDNNEDVFCVCACACARARQILLEIKIECINF